MKAKDIRCGECAGQAKIYGADDRDTEGPWFVACVTCGRETVSWAYQREAWRAWREMNKTATKEIEKESHNPQNFDTDINVGNK